MIHPWTRLGFIRGEYRTGENIHGWDVVGGIRYQFLWAAAGYQSSLNSKGRPQSAFSLRVRVYSKGNCNT
jgi:hypothetical protein